MADGNRLAGMSLRTAKAVFVMTRPFASGVELCLRLISLVVVYDILLLDYRFIEARLHGQVDYRNFDKLI